MTKQYVNTLQAFIEKKKKVMLTEFSKATVEC